MVDQPKEKYKRKWKKYNNIAKKVTKYEKITRVNFLKRTRAQRTIFMLNYDICMYTVSYSGKHFETLVFISVNNNKIKFKKSCQTCCFISITTLRMGNCFLRLFSRLLTKDYHTNETQLIGIPVELWRMFIICKLIKTRHHQHLTCKVCQAFQILFYPCRFYK